MAVVVCNNTTPLSARTFAYSETLFNGGTFCSEGASNFACGAWRDFFNLGEGGRYVQGGQPDPALTPNKNTCQELVNTLLNNNNTFANTLLQETGCTTYRDANGSLVTGCQFSSAPGAFFKTFTPRTGIESTLVERVIASWTCSVTSSDPVYKTACCNASSPNLITGTDPRTGQPFNASACDPSWCLSDPDSVCSATFNVCNALSPCNRHYFLSNIPLPSPDLMLNSLTILPTNSFTPVKGIRCNEWYGETVKQAVQRTALPAVTDRVVSMMNTISGFCGDPRYRGQGECACYNGYLSFGVPWEREDSGDFLENQYDNVTRAPFIVAQDALGQIRRFDAFCSDIGNPSFSAPLSFSYNGTFVTYSNVCSTTTPYSPVEYPYPTVNPARSVRSLTNYGDVVNYTPTDGFGAEIGIETFPMPMHCWLPACVAEGVPDTAVFRNLWALGVQPCPPICYQVSGGVNVSIGGSGAENAHIHDTYVNCDFGYKNGVFPFAYPPACRAMTMDVPANYQGSFTIPFTYASLDISSSFRTTSLSAYVNAFPMIALIDNGEITYSITDKLIDKYDPSNIDIQSVFNLSVSIDATYMDPFSSVLTEIVVANNTYQFDSIILKISVWGSTSNSRGPAFTSGCCAPEFGNGCTPLLEEQLGVPVMSLSDGRALSFFEQALELPLSTVTLSSE